MYSVGNNTKEHNDSFLHRDKITSALFYGVSSVFVIFTNKWLLTEFHFPYFRFVATVQFVTTSIILFVLAVFKKVDIPYLNWSIFREIMPVSLMFLGNVLCGLGSTKALNIPMFTALRRFSILMTLMGEWCFLGDRPSWSVIISVGLMVGGAFVAAMYDLAFDASGYTMVFFNNIFTAMNGIWMRKAALSGKCSKMGVLFYNSLFSGAIMVTYFLAEHNYYTSSQNSGNNLRAVGSPLYSTISTNMIPQLSSPNRLLLSEQPLHQQQQDAVRQLLEHNNNNFQNAIHNHHLRTDKDDTEGRHSQEEPSLLSHHAFSSTAAEARTTTTTNTATTVTSSIEDVKARLSALNHNINQEIHKYMLLNQNNQENSNIKRQMSTEKPNNPIGKSYKIPEPSGVSTITQVMNFPGWSDWRFVLMLLVTCCMGSVLNYAIFLCTTRNSALTTAVVGTLKNVVTSYVGMLVFSDYTFSWVNFIGINISVAGSVYYTLVTMKG